MNQATAIKPNLDLIERNGRKFYILGTAHISRESVDLVEETISAYKPDCVAVELCQARYESIQDPKRWRETDIYRVIKDGQAYVLMAQLALSAFQKRLGSKLQVKPGEEMITAIERAKHLEIPVQLADRDVKVSLKRAWAHAGFWAMLKMSGSLLWALIAPQPVSKEEIENLKTTDMLTDMIDEFGRYLPGVKQALIDERDHYLAKKIYDSQGQSVVAVVGAGHVPGIKKFLGEDIDLKPLEEIPPKKKSSVFFSWAIPGGIILLIAYGFFASGKEIGIEMVNTWILLTGALAAVGAICALAHPLTVIVSFVVAPITTLHPLIAAGWISGLVEAVLRKPKVKDLESLGEDILTLKGLWKNGVTRILLVIALTNLGSALGAVLAFTSIAQNLW